MRVKYIILLLLLICTVPVGAADLVSPYVSGLKPPNVELFNKVSEALVAFKGTRQYSKEWKIETNLERGTIETNWFPEHKGEIWLKVQIAVWGDQYRIDVWQKHGLFPTISKPEWARRYERNVQNAIESYN